MTFTISGTQLTTGRSKNLTLLLEELEHYKHMGERVECFYMPISFLPRDAL